MERVPGGPSAARTVLGLLAPAPTVHAQRDRRVQHAGGPLLPDGRLHAGRYVPAQGGTDVEQGPQMAARADQDVSVERPPRSTRNPDGGSLRAPDRGPVDRRIVFFFFF